VPLTKLQFRPGFNREATPYANEGGWWDGDKVRFRQGLPEKIGGWQKAINPSTVGVSRAIHPWITLDTNEAIGIGSTKKYYVLLGGVLMDITPVRETTAAGDVTFSAAYDTLASDIDAIVDEIPLVSSTGFPPNGAIQIGTETIRYAGVSGNNLTGCVRGFHGTTAASHLATAPVGCATITVSDTANDVLSGDFVTFSGAASLGGNITADILNQEYQVVSVVNGDTYLIEARDVSSIQNIVVNGVVTPTFVFSGAADTGNGGAAVVGEYQIGGGLSDTIFGGGWGAGTWGRGGWGDPADVTVPGAKLRIWSHDNYGEDLIFCVRDGQVFYMDRDALPSRAVELSSMPGENRTPRVAKQIIVSDNDRHVIALGCDDEFSPGVQDPLLIRFSTQEGFLDWESRPTNTAGSLRIGSGSEIVIGVETRQQILIFTEQTLHSMQYLGPPDTFGITMISENISIASPGAVASVDDAVFWMGQNTFYVYDGIAQNLECTVEDFVFSDINTQQMEKIVSGVNPGFNEVWWFYPSSGSQENDRYVVYNYRQQIWYYGSLARTAWTDKVSEVYPLAAGADGYLYLQEIGTDDGSTPTPSAIEAYILSSPISIGNGDDFAFVTRVIPDVTFRGSAPGSVLDMTLMSSDYPGMDYSEEYLSTVTKTVQTQVEQFTKRLDVRLRGRSMFLKVGSDQTGVAWRLGFPRVDVQADGRR
jgi:hypothetical protein